ncbi:hypothetical protein ASA1KI_17320 [Opitutales bacterium ASA1]|uniref:hypothetical protein n=1 Tax=Congregicoccus parvus TaxID=3081749 RepID=UPI002B28582A|nr:hypothetical protein ASA1KI_17320 [Opitutales bacterium ASA1]
MHGTTVHVADVSVSVVPVARGWLALAVASLIIAGLLSLAVVVGRLPWISAWIADPGFFKRCLVVHVDLALVVWFYAFVGGLLAAGVRQPGGWTGWAGPTTAAAGVCAMLGGALVRGAEPVLANYVPVIDHPLFLAGLGLFFMGLLVSLVAMLARPASSALVPATALVALRGAAVAIVLAAATWIAATAGMPPGLDAWTRYEFSAWGAGHVLQVANACAMLGVWFWLAERATGRAVICANTARWLVTALLTPHFAMPLLTMRGTLNNLYHDGATQLMRWGIFPVVLVVMALCVRHLVRHRDAGDAARGALLAGFAASAGLAAFGMILGVCIRGSNTLVPAHYHASLGAVTAAFMAVAYLVAGPGPAAKAWLGPRLQLVLYGAGQFVFALGFAIGGVHGLGRKEYATEQHVRSFGEHAGLIVMGVGGLVAVAGGVWFLVLVVRGMVRWRRGPVAS